MTMTIMTNKHNTQTPPMFSALKINGQKLYELGRQGLEVIIIINY
jgi:tRNA U55 pseudouridine synthase TruB